MKPHFLILVIIVLIAMIFSLFILPNNGLKSVVIVAFLVSIAFLISLNFLKPGTQYQQNIILLGGIGVTIISWFANGYINNENEKNRNRLNIEQSVQQSRQDYKTKFLLDAYFRLSNADYRDTAPPGNKTFLYEQIYLKYAESALNSIQLLGSDSTVKLSNEYNLCGGKQHFNELLITLRNELRHELNLTSLPNTNEHNPTVYRTFRKIGAINDLTPEQQYQLIIKLNEFDRALIK